MASNDPRTILRELVRKNLIGPANDTFADNGAEELITEYPLSKYFSGIIFPHFDARVREEAEIIEPDISFLDEDDLPSEAGETQLEPPTGGEETVFEIEDAGNDDFSRAELFPYSFGLSFCLGREALGFEACLSFGRYRQIDPVSELHKGYKITIGAEDYDLIKNLNAGNGQYLHEVLGYDPGARVAFLRRKLVGDSVGAASGDFANMREIKRVVYQRFSEAKGGEKERYSRMNSILRKITPIYRKAWVRRQCDFKVDIDMDRLALEKAISFSFGKEEDSGFGYSLHALLIEKNDVYNVVKVLVENGSEYSHGCRLILDKPALNRICMFQVGISIENEFLRPLPQVPLPSYAGIEDKIIDCQYRNSSIYALAHNCSCAWQCQADRPAAVFTEFQPSVIPPVTVNSSFAELGHALNVRDNSCFGEMEDEGVVANLARFADRYEDWVQQQDELGSGIGERHADAAASISLGQKEALGRMRKGIRILESRPDIMKLYRLANGAMLVNMSKTLKKNFTANNTEEPSISYHPFQLAFLLVNIDCVVDSGSDLRSKSIDLLWFPTGGGKTEAYFLLAAFSLLFRRYHFGDEGNGTAVIMRYTLRLLTAQQFERASRMILSLNYVCSQFQPALIKPKPYSIGLWIGAASSPNKLHEGDNSAEGIIEKIDGAADREEALRANKFPISDCPWCGASLIELGRTGFSCLKKKLEIRCLNPDCCYHAGLPIDVVDESLYNNPPSLLFATIDKFARLAWVEETTAFFGSVRGYRPPDLIIQDELHLISGPLGSITALFEGVVEMLCRRAGSMPRIIASTATIKNATNQVRSLFGNRAVATFPPPGIDYEDNFFAKVDKNDLNRQYIGIYPTGKTFTTTQIRLLALLLFGRWELRGNIRGRMDDYWTVVSYYNSLRELGRMYSKVRDEIQHAYSQMVLKRDPECRRHWLSNPRELTSRISGYDVKNILHSLEVTNISENEFEDSVYNSIDIVFATNMISVGLDIERLNLIVLNGQPKSISEYIQVTSRIARKHPGLVFTLFNPFRARDKSHYENFSSFHRHYYRFVEPISVTPYTRVAIRKLTPTLLAAYLRLVKGITMPAQVKDKDLDELMSFMANRMGDGDMYRFLGAKINDHMNFLRDRLSQDLGLTFGKLLLNASDAAAMDYENGDWLAVNSMREVSPNAVIKLTTPKPKKRNTDYE